MRPHVYFDTVDGLWRVEWQERSYYCEHATWLPALLCARIAWDISLVTEVGAP